MSVTQEKLERFEGNRRRLVGLAYRLLGEMSEAEDVVQDAYLRWERADTVAVPEAWLTKVVTNLALNRLTSARAKREQYVGTWLPEPVRVDDGALGPLETLEQRETLSLGMLVLLERLTPPERAAFVLREAFGHSHREIAEILDADEVNVRQLYRRAREHVSAERKRFTPTPEQRRKLLEQFIKAALGGDEAGLERLLAEDVVAWADGGGKAPASRQPMVGRVSVVRYLLLMPRYQGRLDMAVQDVNGQPAMMLYLDGELTGVAVPEFDGDRVATVHTVTNPDKLTFLKNKTT